MKTLFITHRFPHPPNRGDSIRSFHFLERFAEMGSVHLATLYEQEPAEDSHRVLNELCAGVLAFPWGKRRRWIRAGVSLLCGKTMTEGLFGDRKLKAALRHLVSTEKFDRIVVFCSSMVQYLDMLRGTVNEQTPVVTDLVDVDSQKWFDYAARARGWKKCVFQMEGERLRKLEIGIGKCCAGILAVTPEETALYRSFAAGKIPEEVWIRDIPNGVDTQYFNAEAPELADVAEIPERLVFVGALDYRANADGVEWFVKNVLPEVRKRFPACEFDVVGSRPGPGLKQLAETTPGMNLIGTVPDVRPYLKRAAAAVIPLQVARGLQNKVLEACSMSRPVIASEGAAEGIHCRTSEDLLVCGTPENWIGKLSELFENAELRSRLSENGRRMVETSYGWSVQWEKLETFLCEVSDCERNSSGSENELS